MDNSLSIKHILAIRLTSNDDVTDFSKEKRRPEMCTFQKENIS